MILKKNSVTNKNTLDSYFKDSKTKTVSKSSIRESKNCKSSKYKLLNEKNYFNNRKLGNKRKSNRSSFYNKNNEKEAKINGCSGNKSFRVDVIECRRKLDDNYEANILTQNVDKEQLNSNTPNTPSATKLKNRTPYHDLLIDQYLKKKNMAPWFRGMSDYQLKACDKLIISLRDDSEQGTTHRVKLCLQTLGLTPSVSSNEIKLIMRLSRNNDIAFLWFLLEMSYKTEGNTYTVNEQLLMSAIAHLDLSITMQELDRLLPPCITEKKITPPEKIEIKSKPIRRSKALWPYFQLQNRPIYEHRTLLTKRPDFRVCVSPYTNNPKPSQIKESYRWFSNYKFQPQRRIVKALLNKEIDDIDDLVVCDIPKSENSSENSIGENRQLCDFHREQQKMEEKFKNELFLIARNRCLKLFDVVSKHKEECEKRVLGQLNQDIDIFMCLYKKMTKKHKYQQVKFLTCSQCVELDVADAETEWDSCDDANCYTEATEHIATMSQVEEKSSGLTNVKSNISCAQNPILNICSYIHGDHINNNGHNNNINSAKVSNDNINNNNNKNNNNNNNNNNHVNKHNYVHNNNLDLQSMSDFQSLSDPNIVNSQKFFKRPTENIPFEFDYTKIFKFERDKLNIKKTFVHAMDSTAEIVENKTNLPVEVNEAASNMIKKLWKENVENRCKYDEELKKQSIKEEKKTYLFPVAYYDPNDKPLMQRMLKTALDVMKNDKKFVLASMPDCDRLAVLREWIYLRYGKTYSHKEVREEYKNILAIHKAIMESSKAVKSFKTKGFNTNVNIDYNCRAYLQSMSKQLKQDLSKDLEDSIMHQSRFFWFAIRAYLWGRGPPRNMYYAYMPAKYSDMRRYRLWRSNEYKDMVAYYRLRSLKTDEKHTY